MQLASKALIGLNNFRQCTRVPAGSSAAANDPNRRRCRKCCFDLMGVANEVVDWIPSISSLLINLADTHLNHPDDSLPSYELAESVCVFINMALKVMELFNTKLAAKLPDCAKSYTEVYRTPNQGTISGSNGSNSPLTMVEKPSALNNAAAAIQNREDEGCIPILRSMASITGEIFPRRPLVCPRITFRNDGSCWND